MIVLRGLALVVILAAMCSATVAGAEPSPVRRPVSTRRAAGRPRLAVDVVGLKSGRTVRGAIAHEAGNGSLTMAVGRDWLNKNNAPLFAKITREENATRRAALAQLRDRLDRELSSVRSDSRLASFLQSERKRAARMLAEPPPAGPQFVWLDLTRREIAKVKPAATDLRRIAAWSWCEHLTNVETRDAGDLAQELTGKGVNPDQPLPDLGDRFPLRMQDDREWRARMALVTYALDKPLDFQGTADVLVPVDRSAKPKEMGPIVARLLAGQATAQLHELLGSGGAATAPASSEPWLKRPSQEAAARRARAFRATRVDLNRAGRQASVESVFAVQLAGGDWKDIWSDRATEDATKERADLESTIAGDEQVKGVLESLKLPGTGAGDVRQAIRFAAATMAAQQAVDGHFFAFEGRYLGHLDVPPLWSTP